MLYEVITLSRISSLIVPVAGLSGEEAVPGKRVSPDNLRLAHMRVDERYQRGQRVRVRRGVITSYSIHYTKLYDLREGKGGGEADPSFARRARPGFLPGPAPPRGCVPADQEVLAGGADTRASRHAGSSRGDSYNFV